MISFQQTFELLTGFPPFHWQSRLYERFLQGEIPETCVLPTGLGKTSVITIWLIALANQAELPRRLLYVVNRRTVVDQTTTEVEKLCARLPECPEVKDALNAMCALPSTGADSLPLAISTLRGQHADNQQWSTDPARPAVICGTVDMIGSRLLFSGYRCGFKTRPLQAGFLGQDALLVHDEAHLEPAFQSLIEDIQSEQTKCQDERPLRVMALSATARSSSGLFVLDEKDHQEELVLQRIAASKRLALHPIENEKKELIDELASQALTFRTTNQAIIVFARSVETVERVSEAIRKELKRHKLPQQVATLTGTMRGLERNLLVDTPLFQRFMPPFSGTENSDRLPGTVYLICTSAGEVGVNISADHLVCDLSPFDNMAQRLGRVNRFGEQPETEVHVVHPVELPTEEEAANNPGLKMEVSRKRTLDLLRQLDGQASPLALEQLDPLMRQKAFSPVPEILPVTSILFDAWANTTVQNLPGRPPVEEYLHGVSEWEPPRTELAWREEIESLGQPRLTRLGLEPEDLLADYPLKPHELMSDRSDRVFDGLKKLHDRIVKDHQTLKQESPLVPVWITEHGDRTVITTLSEILQGDKKAFAPKTILLAPKYGGLREGLFGGFKFEVHGSWASAVREVI